MKTRTYLILLASIFVASCSSKSEINIEIPEIGDGSLAIVYASPDNMGSSTNNVIYNADFKDGKANINLDSISFDKDIMECALQIINSDESFSANIPLPLEKGKKIDIKFTNIDEYNKGGRLKTSYKGSKHAEEFTVFWDKIQNQLVEFVEMDDKDKDKGYEKFVGIYKPYIDQYPSSGFPYILMIPQIKIMNLENQNPLLDFANDICIDSKNNRWKEVLCSLLGERRLALETSKRLVFNAVDIHGKSYSENDIKGELILIDFWASWCKPCRDEIPHLKQIHNQYNKKGLTLVGISIDRTAEDWRGFLSTNPLPWLSLYGDGHSLTKRYDFEYIPFNLIVDSQGNILANNLHGEELDKFLEEFFRNNEI